MENKLKLTSMMTERVPTTLRVQGMTILCKPKTYLTDLRGRRAICCRILWSMLGKKSRNSDSN